jgi:hypothetical protein
MRGSADGAWSFQDDAAELDGSSIVHIVSYVDAL